MKQCVSLKETERFNGMKQTVSVGRNKSFQWEETMCFNAQKLLLVARKRKRGGLRLPHFKPWPEEFLETQFQKPVLEVFLPKVLRIAKVCVILPLDFIERLLNQ